MKGLKNDSIIKNNHLMIIFHIIKRSQIKTNNYINIFKFCYGSQSRLIKKNIKLYKLRCRIHIIYHSHAHLLKVILCMQTEVTKFKD